MRKSLLAILGLSASLCTLALGDPTPASAAPSISTAPIAQRPDRADVVNVGYCGRRYGRRVVRSYSYEPYYYAPAASYYAPPAYGYAAPRPQTRITVIETGQPVPPAYYTPPAAYYTAPPAYGYGYYGNRYYSAGW